MPWKLKRAASMTGLLLLLTLPVTACQTIRPTLPPIPTIAVVPCAALRTISYDSEHDSEQTISEVRRENAVRKAICGK